MTEVCFEVGCTSLGSFSSRFTELVGESPSAYRARRHEDGRRHPALRRQDPHATGQEWRSEPCSAARNVKRMDIELSTCFIAVDDHDKALAFYRDVLGLEVRNDVGFEGMRWVTVGAPSQPGVEIVLEPPLADPNASPADQEAMAELLAKGLLRGVMFRTDDCDATFERIRAAGAEVLQEPIDHALRRPRLRLPRSLRQHAALHPAERRLSSGQQAFHRQGSEKTAPSAACRCSPSASGPGFAVTTRAASCLPSSVFLKALA